MKNHHAINGKTHYFYGHFQVRKLLVITRGYKWGSFQQASDCQVLILGMILLFFRTPCLSLNLPGFSFWSLAFSVETPMIRIHNSLLMVI